MNHPSHPADSGEWDGAVLSLPPGCCPEGKGSSKVSQVWLFIFRERGKEGEGEKEKHQCECEVAFHAPPTGDLARNPGIHPDWESNRRPFGLQAGTQSTEPHWPGQHFLSSLLKVPSAFVFSQAPLLKEKQTSKQAYSPDCIQVLAI